MDIFSAELGKHLRIMNIYGPNQNGLDFWQQFLDNRPISQSSILGGDLNFSMGHEES